MRRPSYSHAPRPSPCPLRPSLAPPRPRPPDKGVLTNDSLQWYDFNECTTCSSDNCVITKYDKVAQSDPQTTCAGEAGRGGSVAAAGGAALRGGG